MDSPAASQSQIWHDAYQTHHRRWIGFAGACGGATHAEGIVHGLLSKWWETRRRFGTPDGLDRLMMASIPNRARDLFVRRRRQADFPPENLPGYTQPQTPCEFRPDRLLLAGEEACRIWPLVLDTLSGCTGLQVEAFLLRYRDELKSAEIASIQRTDPGTARKRVQRVRKRIEACLASARRGGLISDPDAVGELIFEMISARFGSLDR